MVSDLDGKPTNPRQHVSPFASGFELGEGCAVEDDLVLASLGHDADLSAEVVEHEPLGVTRAVREDQFPGVQRLQRPELHVRWTAEGFKRRNLDPLHRNAGMRAEVVPDISQVCAPRLTAPADGEVLHVAGRCTRDRGRSE